VTYNGRRFLAGFVTVLASAVILVTLLAHYAQTLVDPAGFANKAVAVVHTQGVESIIASTVDDRIVSEVRGASTVEPEISSAVSEALASEQVSTDIREAAVSLQSQLVSGRATSLTLALPDFGSSLASSIESRSALLADEVRNLGTVTVLNVPIPSSDATLIHDLARAGNDFSLLIILSVALAALALLISPTRARTLRGLGVGVTLVGLVAAAAYLIGRGIVANEFSPGDARTAADAVWNTYLGSLEVWGFVLAGGGVVVAVVASTAARSRRY
jgi:hypothetical protein